MDGRPQAEPTPLPLPPPLKSTPSSQVCFHCAILAQGIKNMRRLCTEQLKERRTKKRHDVGGFMQKTTGASFGKKVRKFLVKGKTHERRTDALPHAFSLSGKRTGSGQKHVRRIKFRFWRGGKPARKRVVLRPWAMQTKCKFGSYERLPR